MMRRVPIPKVYRELPEAEREGRKIGKQISEQQNKQRDYFCEPCREFPL